MNKRKLFTATARQQVADDRLSTLLAERLWCYYIPTEGFVEGHGWRVSIVIADEPGHYPTGNWPCDYSQGHKMPWFWGQTLDEAKETAERENLERLGLTPADAFKIVMSSMAAKESSRDRAIAFDARYGGKVPR